jgi:hypothetical protein
LSPDATFPAPGGYFAGEDASGFGPPLQLSVNMTDPASGLGIFLYGGGSAAFYGISEYRLSDNHQLVSDTGYWTYASVPEPSLLALLSVGVTALLCRATTGKT